MASIFNRLQPKKTSIFDRLGSFHDESSQPEPAETQPGGGAAVRVELLVPDKSVGLIIGKKGSRHKEMNSIDGIEYVEIANRGVPTKNRRRIVILGSSTAVGECHTMIESWTGQTFEPVSAGPVLLESNPIEENNATEADDGLLEADDNDAEHEEQGRAAPEDATAGGKEGQDAMESPDDPDGSQNRNFLANESPNGAPLAWGDSESDSGTPAVYRRQEADRRDAKEPPFKLASPGSYSPNHRGRSPQQKDGQYQLAPSPQYDARRQSPTSRHNVRRRSPSPRRNERRRSASPQRYVRRRSQSPPRNVRRQSPSPQRNSHKRSPSPKRDGRRRSLSPPRDVRRQSPSLRKSRRRSPSLPLREAHRRSLSPRRNAHLGTPSPQRELHRRSRSPHRDDHRRRVPSPRRDPPHRLTPPRQDDRHYERHRRPPSPRRDFAPAPLPVPRGPAYGGQAGGHASQASDRSFAEPRGPDPRTNRYDNDRIRPGYSSVGGGRSRSRSPPRQHSYHRGPEPQAQPFDDRRGGGGRGGGRAPARGGYDDKPRHPTAEDRRSGQNSAGRGYGGHARPLPPDRGGNETRPYDRGAQDGFRDNRPPPGRRGGGYDSNSGSRGGRWADDAPQVVNDRGPSDRTSHENYRGRDDRIPPSQRRSPPRGGYHHNSSSDDGNRQTAAPAPVVEEKSEIDRAINVLRAQRDAKINEAKAIKLQLFEERSQGMGRPDPAMVSRMRKRMEQEVSELTESWERWEQNEVAKLVAASAADQAQPESSAASEQAVLVPLVHPSVSSAADGENAVVFSPFKI